MPPSLWPWPACLTGRTEEAVAHARKAIEGNRNFAFPYCVLALGCARLGQADEAAQAVAGWLAPRRAFASARCAGSGLPTPRASSPISICCARPICRSDCDRAATF